MRCAGAPPRACPPAHLVAFDPRAEAWTISGPAAGNSSLVPHTSWPLLHAALLAADHRDQAFLDDTIMAGEPTILQALVSIGPS